MRRTLIPDVYNRYGCREIEPLIVKGRHYSGSRGYYPVIFILQYERFFGDPAEAWIGELYDIQSGQLRSTNFIREHHLRRDEPVTEEEIATILELYLED